MNFLNSSFEDYRSKKNLKVNVGLDPTVTGQVRQHPNLTDGNRPLTTGKDCWQHGTDGFFINPKNKKEMKQVEVVFHDDDIRCTVILPNGKEETFIQVSAMLNWCAENNYQPVIGKEQTK